MSDTAEPVTNDPIALRAMLAAERAENERLRRIIKELQRHRFGRRADRGAPDDPRTMARSGEDAAPSCFRLPQA